MGLYVDIIKRFKGFNLEVKIENNKKTLGILGPSGSGKSMTLRAIAGLEKPDQGIIRIGDRELFNSYKGIDLSPRDRRVGYLFQNYALFPNMSVIENIKFGASKDGDTLEYIQRMMERFHLSELKNRKPNQLSGGQQQRVALARVLAAKPEMIMLDEPFSALDDHLRIHMLREMKSDIEEFQGSTLFVTHNIDEAYRMCQDISIYYNGRIVASGEKNNIFNFPPNPETAKITGCKNIFEDVHIDKSNMRINELGIDLNIGDRDVLLTKNNAFIRANNINLKMYQDNYTLGENEFCGEVHEIIESPFRINLFIKLNGPKLLQVESSKEKWEAIKGNKLIVEIPGDRIVC